MAAQSQKTINKTMCMKKNWLLLLLLFCVSMANAQQYATGKWAKLINQGYVQIEEIKELKGYTFHSFTVLTLDTPSLSITFYIKGSSYVIVMTREEDNIKTITDVVEVLNVKKNQQFLVSQCTIGKQGVAPDLVVLVQNPPANSLKAKPLKAWRADRDKTHFKTVSIKNMSCLFENL
jgi:hypothetical protein